MAYTLTQAQTVSIRKHAGYPVVGNGLTNLSSTFYYQQYGNLEYRLLNLSDGEGAEVSKFLTTLDTLEAAIPAAGDNLTADAASSYKHNANEIRDRMRLYDYWRKRLCSYLGIPPGPDILGGGHSVGLVV